MDQLTACRILGLNEGASKEEIKASYARLSKDCHPEEHPEEFRQIHEAFSLLMKAERGRRKGNRPAGETRQAGSRPAGETRRTGETEKKASWRQNEEALAESFKEEADEEPVPHRYGFDEAIEHAEVNEQEYMHQMVMQAAAEMEILLTNPYKERLRLFRRFFKKEEYQNVLRTPEFMRLFAQMLTKADLKKPVYEFFIDYYRLRGMMLQELCPEAAALYRILNRKCGMYTKTQSSIEFLIPCGVAFVLGIQSFTQSVVKTVGILSGCAVILIALILVYRKLYENHSGMASQGMIASVIMITQAVAMAGGLYAPVLGEDDGFMTAFLLFAVSGIWLIGLGIAAAVRKISAHFSK